MIAPASKSRKREKTVRIVAMLASICSAVSSVRLASLPEGSPILLVPPPISAIGRWPVFCNQRNIMIVSRLPIWRLGAVASKPTYATIAPAAALASSASGSETWWRNPRLAKVCRDSDLYVLTCRSLGLVASRARLVQQVYGRVATKDAGGAAAAGDRSDERHRPLRRRRRARRYRRGERCPARPHGLPRLCGERARADPAGDRRSCHAPRSCVPARVPGGGRGAHHRRPCRGGGDLPDRERAALGRDRGC